jgi:hypothetical protein
MAGAPALPGGTPPELRLPSRRELRLRARWLAEMADEDRDALWDLPLGEVEARFAAWRDVNAER